MNRVILAIICSLVAEYWAFQLYRSHPLVRPSYFQTVLLVIEMTMCWSGIEAARWLLRKSPVAKTDGVESDWTRLWLWVGPPGGILLALVCYLGKWADSLSESRLAGPLIVAHICGGAFCWMVSGFWAIPEAFSDAAMTGREKMLAFAGLLSHSLGFWVYAMVYPAKTVPPIALVGSALFFFFLLFYLAATCSFWALLFKVWPGPKARELKRIAPPAELPAT